MRLTEKDGSYKEYIFGKDLQNVIGVKEWNNALTQKLGQLEDIEDELGIDLITLFKALRKGIYIKNQKQTRYPLALLRTHYSNHTTRYYVFDNGKEKEVKLKDYGKTWALTKEELE